MLGGWQRVDGLEDGRVFFLNRGMGALLPDVDVVDLGGVPAGSLLVGVGSTKSEEAVVILPALLDWDRKVRVTAVSLDKVVLSGLYREIDILLCGDSFGCRLLCSQSHAFFPYSMAFMYMRLPIPVNMLPAANASPQPIKNAPGIAVGGK